MAYGFAPTDTVALGAARHSVRIVPVEAAIVAQRQDPHGRQVVRGGVGCADSSGTVLRIFQTGSATLGSTINMGVEAGVLQSTFLMAGNNNTSWIGTRCPSRCPEQPPFPRPPIRHNDCLRGLPQKRIPSSKSKHRRQNQPRQAEGQGNNMEAKKPNAFQLEERFEILKEEILSQRSEKSILYIPNRGNWGDALIRQGTPRFLRDARIDFTEVKEDRRKAITSLGENHLILFGGGGAWCRMWDCSGMVEELCKRNKVIALSSTYELQPRFENATFSAEIVLTVFRIFPVPFFVMIWRFT